MNKIIFCLIIFNLFVNTAFCINRQDIGSLIKDYPDGEVLQIYIPYETDVAINGELFHIKLVKLFEQQINIVNSFFAKNIFYTSRTMLWMKWKDFQSKLSYNEENVRKAILESVKNCERLNNYKKNGLWSNEFQNFNCGFRNDGSVEYYNYFDSENISVEGNVNLIMKRNIGPVYTMKDISGDNYWQITTDYIKKVVNELTDWNNPEFDSKDMPPFTFCIKNIEIIGE